MSSNAIPSATSSTVDALVFCGGSGTRGLVHAWAAAAAAASWGARRGRARHHQPLSPPPPPPPPPLHLVVPVTDDGGSSRELMRRVGGPAVGDLRNVALSVATALFRTALASPTNSTPLGVSPVWAWFAPAIAAGANAPGVNPQPGIDRDALQQCCPFCAFLRGRRATGECSSSGSEEEEEAGREGGGAAARAARAACAVPVLKQRLPDDGDGAAALAHAERLLLLLETHVAVCAGVVGGAPCSPSADVARWLRRALDLLQSPPPLPAPAAVRAASEMDFRGASIGNLVLTVMLLENLGSGIPAPLQCAVNALAALAGWGGSSLGGEVASSAAAAPLFAIHPHLELRRRGGDQEEGRGPAAAAVDVMGPDREELLLLPRVAMHTWLSDGTHYNSQCHLSYDIPATNAEMVVAATQQQQLATAAAAAVADASPAPMVSPLVLKRVRDIAPLSAPPMAVRLCVERPKGDAARGAFHWCGEESAAAALTRAPLVLFSRGSLLTSVAAAALPFASQLLERAALERRGPVAEGGNCDGSAPPTASARPGRQRRVLLLNGTRDRETSAFTSAAHLTATFVRLLLGAAASSAATPGGPDEPREARPIAKPPLSAREAEAAAAGLITDVVFPRGSPLVTREEAAAGQLHIAVSPRASAVVPLHCCDTAWGSAEYDDDALVSMLVEMIGDCGAA